jgi:hypothetical protein
LRFFFAIPDIAFQHSLRRTKLHLKLLSSSCIALHWFFWFSARIVLLSAVRGCADGSAAFDMSIGDGHWRWDFEILFASAFREFCLLVLLCFAFALP